MNEKKYHDMPVITKIKVSRKITDVDEVLASPEFAEIFAGYENNICYEKDSLLNRTKFIAAYIIPPTTNGGLNGYTRIYKHYICDGTHFLGEIRLGSMLSDTPFSEWTEDENGDLLFFRRNWSKCESNRKLFRTHQTKVTTLH
jgi:hypothetical protein